MADPADDWVLPPAARPTAGDDWILPAAQAPQMDFTRPQAEVRADIAKIPEGPLRDQAVRQWADAAVKRDRAAERMPFASGHEPILPYVRDRMRDAVRGTLLVGPALDEISAGANAAVHWATGGAAGAPYNERVEYERAIDRAIAKEAPVASTVTQLGTGLVSGGAVAKKVFEGAKKVLPKIIAAPAAGGAVGVTVGGISGFGEGEGGFDARLKHATSGEGKLFGLSPIEAGGILGTALPPGIAGASYLGSKAHEFVSPSLARMGTHLTIPEWMKIKASAASLAAPDPASAGTKAAAEQIVANWLVDEGVKPGEIAERLRKIAEAGRYGSSGQAQDVSALVDVTPGLQRLGRTVATTNQEAATGAKQFLEARQTGLTPLGTTAEAMAARGLPTRERMAAPIKGEEAIEQLGSHFGAGKDNLVPMGQGERFSDALKRAFGIKDTDFHGHAANATRTDDAIVAAAKLEARSDYGAMREAAKGYDITPHLQPVVDTITSGLRAPELGPTTARIIARGLQEFMVGKGQNRHLVSSMQAFDEAKRAVDAIIEKAARAGDTNIGRVLRGTPDEPGLLRLLTAAVDGIQDKNIGPLYRTARAKFSSRMESQEALEAGRKAAEVGGDDGVRLFDTIAGNEGHEKLFRLGVVGHVESKAGGKHGADKSAIFDTQNMDKLLAYIIPRSEKAGAVFADRPQRFGRYVDIQKAQAETRNMVQGGSPTERIKADVNKFDIMSKWQELKEASGSLPVMGIKAATLLLNKMFGIRQDSAAYIARQLFTANKQQQRQFLAKVEERLGRNRMEQFTRLMEQHQQEVLRSGARQGGTPQE